MTRPITMLASVLLILGAAASRGHAQDSARAELPGWIFVGSAVESYLRYLQTLGKGTPYPWSVRAFSPGELRRLAPPSSDHPWGTSPAMRSTKRALGPLRVDVVPIAVQSWFNTSFPYGMNDGAVWAGRGMTAAVSGGVIGGWGPITVTLAPEAFVAENRSFALTPNGRSDALRFADGLNPNNVDRPQRFGEGRYARLDPGQSSVHIELFGASAGLSTANQWWGPMSEYPYVLGNNAAGFPHVFFGSSRPFNVWIGRVHGRFLYGRLEQSAFSPVTTGNGRRFAGGAVATFEPRGVPGLELGLTRFFHVAWPDSGLTGDYFAHLFETFLKFGITKVFAPRPGDPSTSSDNQLASAFARWVFPRSGVEVYGEYGREDHNADLRDFILEPDHSATYGLGFRKAWRKVGGLVAVRAEVMNYQTSILARHRGEGGIYRHGGTPQGHTNRGQLLGTAAAVGSGAASSVVFERFAPGGLIRAGWSRFVVQDGNGSIDRTDVQHTLRFERRFQRGSLEIRSAIDAVFEFNRNFASDKGNFRGELGSVWYP